VDTQMRKTETRHEKFKKT